MAEQLRSQDAAWSARALADIEQMLLDHESSGEALLAGMDTDDEESFLNSNASGTGGEEIGWENNGKGDGAGEAVVVYVDETPPSSLPPSSLPLLPHSQTPEGVKELAILAAFDLETVVREYKKREQDKRRRRNSSSKGKAVQRHPLAGAAQVFGSAAHSAGMRRQMPFKRPRRTPPATVGAPRKHAGGGGGGGAGVYTTPSLPVGTAAPTTPKRSAAPNVAAENAPAAPLPKQTTLPSGSSDAVERPVTIPPIHYVFR